jgi:hypothetical protein
MMRGEEGGKEGVGLSTGDGGEGWKGRVEMS